MSETKSEGTYYTLTALLKYHNYQALEIELMKLKDSDGMSDDLSDKLLSLVKLAVAITQLDIDQVEKLAPATEYGELAKGSLIEKKSYYYLQTMTLQLARNEFGNYLRGFTPLLVDVLRIVVERELLPNLSEFIQPIAKDTIDGDRLYRGLQWSQERIERDDNLISKTWKKYYGQYFNYDHYVSSSHLTKIIETHSKNKTIVELSIQLRKIEKYLRNLVAHEIVMVDEQFFIDRIQLKPTEVHQILLDLYDEIGLTNEIQRNSLKILRQNIFDQLTNTDNRSKEEHNK